MHLFKCEHRHILRKIPNDLQYLLCVVPLRPNALKTQLNVFKLLLLLIVGTSHTVFIQRAICL